MKLFTGLQFWEGEKAPSKLWQLFYSIIVDQVNEQCPVRKVKIRKSSLPWMTREVL